MTKYHNKVTSGYDSRKEKRRATDLFYLQKAGEISGLREQVAFELLPAQYREKDGRRVCVERAVNYVADFAYTDKEGNFVVEDTKGFRTKDYIIKRKLMLWLHGIEVREV